MLDGSTADIILRCPWLKHHNHHLSWTSGDIISWSDSCFETCLQLPARPSSTIKSAKVLLRTTTIESSEGQHDIVIPEEYRAFQDVFSKQLATRLPSHRPWDCAIELLPGATLPKGRVYPLSIPEQKAMGEYVEEALRQGYIHPSTSSAASSFFFVAKKDRGLRPCIDYRALNKQTVLYKYTLPLVPVVLEMLRGASIFTKLDLRSAYNLIRIRRGDEWKTTFITPSGHYEYRVMPYGLANSPSVLQAFMNEVFREYLHRFVIIYIDEILIYSWNEADHHLHVAQVLQKLRENRLYLKLEKFEFHNSSIQFFGYINAKGIQMDQKKVDAVRNWPIPT